MPCLDSSIWQSCSTRNLEHGWADRVLWTCDYHNLDSPMQLQSGVPRSQLVGLEMMWSGHCPHINTVYIYQSVLEFL